MVIQMTVRVTILQINVLNYFVMPNSISLYNLI